MSTRTLTNRERESQEIKILTTRVGRVEKKVDTLNSKVDVLNTRVDRVEAKVDHLDRRVERLESKVDNLDSRMGKLEVKVDQLGSKVDNLDRRVGKLEVKVDQLDSKVDNLDRRVGKLEVKVDQLDRKVDDLDSRVERVEAKVDQLDRKVDDLRVELKGDIKQLGDKMERLIGNLGSRWGIYNESIWRQTIGALIEGTYGDRVEERFIEGEQFDVVISNGDHILLEITARFRGGDLRKVLRKRELYTTHVQPPRRFIVAAAHIHSRQAIALQNAGFELIEPEDEL